MSIESLQYKLAQILPDACLEKQFLQGNDRLRLWLIMHDYPVTGLEEEAAERVMDNPLYWIFCWASGVVLAKYILENPDIVRGKVVLDFGSGSGVVAIAACIAGAKKVYASDIDILARDAIAENALLNNVSLEIIGDFKECMQRPDLITVADVLYDSDNIYLLDELMISSDELLLADSRVKNFSYPGLCHSGVYAGETFPCLGGFDEFSEVNIFKKVITGTNYD